MPLRFERLATERKSCWPLAVSRLLSLWGNSGVSSKFLEAPKHGEEKGPSGAAGTGAAQKMMTNQKIGQREACNSKVAHPGCLRVYTRRLDVACTAAFQEPSCDFFWLAEGVENGSCPAAPPAGGGPEEALPLQKAAGSYHPQQPPLPEKTTNGSAPSSAA